MRLNKSLPVVLAGALQAIPMLRAVLPAQAQALAPSTWAHVLRLATGAVAYLGFHAISSATTFIPPAGYTFNLTVGVATNLNIAYSGAHVPQSWSASPNPVCPGLTLALGSASTTISGTPTTAGTYTSTIRAWSGNGATGDNTPASYTFNVAGSGSPTPPVITNIVASPSSSVAVGTSVTLTPRVGGPGPLQYRWRFNSTNLAGGTNAALTLTNVQMTSAGTYTLIVSNAVGAATNSATLTVTSAPVITNQPRSQIALQGTNVTFTVGASGAGLAYQWRFNSNILANANAPSLTLTNVGPAQSGFYSAVVSNSAGSMVSSNAQLLVVVPPAAGQAPRLASIAADSSQLTLSFPTAPGYRYLLQTNAALATPNWGTLSNVAPSFNGGSISLVQRCTNAPRLFYRVVVQAQ
jgi:hypothetical protein